MKTLIIVFAAVAISFSSSAQEYVSLSVEVEGISSKEGSLRIGLFNNDKDWLEKPVKSMVINLQSAETHLFVLDSLQPGNYAVSIIHDKNNNGELDMGMMGPTEAYGFSNNARGMFGPADYKDALVTVDTEKTEKIKIR